MKRLEQLPVERRDGSWIPGALLWLGMAEWARLHDTVFAGEAQLRQFKTWYGKWSAGR